MSTYAATAAAMPKLDLSLGLRADEGVSCYCCRSNVVMRVLEVVRSRISENAIRDRGPWYA